MDEEQPSGRRGRDRNAGQAADAGATDRGSRSSASEDAGAESRAAAAADDAGTAPPGPVAPEADAPVNIGPLQQRARMAIGIVTLVASVLVAVWLIGYSGLGALWRLALFIPFYAGAHSVIEGWLGVGSYLAQNRERNLDAVLSRSGRPIENEALAEAILERSAKATLGAALVAGLFTSVCLLVPAP